MKHSPFVVLCLGLAGLLTGCASSGRIGELPVVAASDSSSDLVLIRTSSFAAAAISYYVALDGKDVFSIRSGQYTKFPIPTGDHLVAVKCFGGWSPTWKEDSKAFVALPNRPTYFEISPNMSCAEIKPVEAEFATQAIGKSTFVDPGVASK